MDECKKFRRDWLRCLMVLRVLFGLIEKYDGLGFRDDFGFVIPKIDGSFRKLNEHRYNCRRCFVWEQENCSTVPVVFFGSRREPEEEFPVDDLCDPPRELGLQKQPPEEPLVVSAAT